MPEKDYSILHRNMLNMIKSMSRIQQERQKVMMGVLETDLKMGGSLMSKMMEQQMDPSYQMKMELLNRMRQGKAPITSPSSQTTSVQTKTANVTPVQTTPVQTISTETEKPSDYIWNPNFLATGEGTPYIENPEAKQYRTMETKKAEAKIKSGAESMKGTKIVEQNVRLVSGAVNRLAQTYVDAYEEKGVGDIGRSISSETALFMGGKIGEKYPATAAFSGQKTEVITKMMPLLTQQGDKPGSVRLVSTVFDKLMKTLPAKNTPPTPARRMMAETIRNMFGFAKAVKDMGITNEAVQNLNDKQLKEVGNSIERYSQSIQFTPEEQAQLDNLLSAALAPLDELIQSEGHTTSKQYQVDQIIVAPNGKRYRVTGGNPNDPDLEEVQ